MSFFIPGKIVTQFVSKRGLSIVLRYPKWEDLQQLWGYMNTLSKEDIYLSLSGENLSLLDEAEWLAQKFVQLEMRNSVVLLAVEEDKIIGVCNVDRNFNNRSRGMHIGTFGISLLDKYRSQGIGYFFARQVILEAKEKMNDLRQIHLTLFSENQNAYNLYQKLGFKFYGKAPQALLYKENFQDEISMYLKI
jgi:RimJ/RimL family protein N-acetyltransferase